MYISCCTVKFELWCSVSSCEEGRESQGDAGVNYSVEEILRLLSKL